MRGRFDSIWRQTLTSPKPKRFPTYPRSDRPSESSQFLLSPDQFVNAGVFHSPVVATNGTLFAALFVNAATFFPPTRGGSIGLTPSLYSDADTFFAPTVNLGTALIPSMYVDPDLFFAPVVTKLKNLTPSLYADADTFFAATVSNGSQQWPDATNTGTSGTLTPFSSTIFTSSNGQLIENMESAAFGIHIQHINVTVRNCKVGAITSDENKTGIIIEDCEITGEIWNSGISIVNGNTGARVSRCNIHNCENGVFCSANGITIEDNYFHDLEWEGAPHIDCIQFFNGETGATVTGNNFETSSGGASSCVTMSNGTNFLIDGNRFSGAAYQLRIEDVSTGHTVSNNTFINNWAFGYIVDEGSSNTFTNNIFDGTNFPTGHP